MAITIILLIVVPNRIVYPIVIRKVKLKGLQSRTVIHGLYTSLNQKIYVYIMALWVCIEEGIMVIDVTDQNFEAEVVKSTLPALVDLWAPWCGPCKMIAPIVEKLAEDYDGRFKFCKLNVDDNQQIAAKYGVRAIPTMIFFKDGEAVDTVVGAVSKQALQQKIDSLL